MYEYTGLQMIKILAESEINKMQIEYEKLSIGRRILEKQIHISNLNDRQDQLMFFNTNTFAIIHSITSLKMALKELDILIESVGNRPAQ